ncbi:AMP-binding protein [Patescibacteria group bacterium]|nr:AMP-binding protein [Patescibacteria group bacterium]
MYDTVPEFLSSIADQYGNKTALHIRRLFQTAKYSYRDLETFSRKTARFLAKHHVRPGDRVMIWAPNMPEWVIVLMGSLTAGATVVPAMIHSSGEVVEKYIRRTKPKLLFTSRFYPLGLSKNQTVNTLFLEDLPDLLREVDDGPLPTPHPDELAEIVFTSGTTGEPKGVMITQRNILYEIEKLLATIPSYKEYRLLSILPLSHVMEQIVGLFAPLARGATIYYIPRINTLTIRKALRKYHITDLGVVPQMLRMFLDTIEFEISEKKLMPLFRILRFLTLRTPFPVRRTIFRSIHASLGGKLYVFGVGSAPLPVHLAEAWEAIGIRVVEGYGASELTGGITANFIDHRRLGSVGKIIPGMDVKLSSEGEVLARGPNVTPGYFENPEKTGEAFAPDGYFRTGDIGYFDRNGYLYITGREKFKIVTAAGDKVYPEDIEKILNGNPYVWDSCAVGLPDGDGESLTVAVILHPDSHTSLEGIIRWANSRLESHQQIRASILWPDKDFPRLSTLKIDRHAVQTYLLERKKQPEKAAHGLSATKGDALVTLLGRVTHIRESAIHDNSFLVRDLGFDSLKRVELVSLIEEEFDREIDETAIGKDTTVTALRRLIHTTSVTQYPYDIDTIAAALRKPWNQTLRVFLQNTVLFPFLRIFVRITVESAINFSDITLPVVFVGNHPNPPYDAACLFQALPTRIRRRLVGPGDDTYWKNVFALWTRYVSSPLTGAYPIDKHGGPVAKALDVTADFLDDGYAVFILPEGAPTPKGALLGPLKSGVEVLLSGTNIPLIPYFVSGNLGKTFPRYEETFHLLHYVPHGISHIRLAVGKPFTLRDVRGPGALALIRKNILDLAPPVQP